MSLSPIVLTDFSDFSEFSDPLITYSVSNHKKKSPVKAFDFDETTDFNISKKNIERCSNLLIIGILTFFFIFILFYVLHKILKLI
jgi:hypothetical protein